MTNAATLIAGLAALAVVFAAMYLTYRSMKRGECAGCSGCPKGRDSKARGKCSKEKE